MELEVVGLAFRGLERIIIVCAAFFSIYLGFRIFDKDLQVNSSLDGEMFGWKVKLRRVGPGIFFALFGAVVLSVSLTAPFLSGLSPNATMSGIAEGSASNRQIQYGQGAQIYNEHTELVSAVSSVSYAIELITREGSGVPPEHLPPVVSGLTSLREALIRQTWPRWAGEYSLLLGKLKDSCGDFENLSPEEKYSFRELMVSLKPFREDMQSVHRCLKL